jgi:hypothetical protein
MRRRQKLGTLPPERVAQLEAAGIVWSSGRNEEGWRQKLAELTDHRQRHGHTDLPRHWPENQPLADWVVWQRIAKHAGKLSTGRVRALEAVGFEWMK